MKIDAVHKNAGGRSSATDDSISSCLFLSAGTFCPNLTSCKNVRIETQGATISGTNSLATKLERYLEAKVRDEDDDDDVDVKVASLDY